MSVEPGFIIRAMKAMFGDLKITVDRERKIVTISREEQFSELTYDQVIDKIEEIFKRE